ncbi:hypothetical protein [Actinomycetospora sp. NBRC 106378]|jgi:hypothetical protein|uniref:hypothetical protein n=1 Tax=Actinomycetospora sp. NBRC 106378 TaxID=3032208 RepID=UPI0024A403AB|nr:hypothetical protein [Actinomycetospora sp. NBRC 106378]GLZ53865.1 hypothetical protein Acsp07_34820 [Actinomycetospora sp. NBRC 106378]
MRTRVRHGHAVTALLLQARSIVLVRRRTGRYDDLSDAAVNVVSNGLTGVAVDPSAVPAPLREEATALAHRIVDDDHPEDSPLWPPPGEDLPVTSWIHPSLVA